MYYYFSDYQSIYRHKRIGNDLDVGPVTESFTNNRANAREIKQILN